MDTTPTTELTAEQVGETANGWPLFAVIHPTLGVLATYAAEDAEDALEQADADTVPT